METSGGAPAPAMSSDGGGFHNISDLNLGSLLEIKQGNRSGRTRPGAWGKHKIRRLIEKGFGTRALTSGKGLEKARREGE